jgi:hypothetical protein
MADRMEQVRDLLVAELRERGDIDEQDHIGECVALISVKRALDDRLFSWVHTLETGDTDDAMVLGLMEHKRVQVQANVNDAISRIIAEGDG